MKKAILVILALTIFAVPALAALDRPAGEVEYDDGRIALQKGDAMAAAESFRQAAEKGYRGAAWGAAVAHQRAGASVDELTRWAIRAVEQDCDVRGYRAIRGLVEVEGPLTLAGEWLRANRRGMALHLERYIERQDLIQQYLDAYKAMGLRVPARDKVTLWALDAREYAGEYVPDGKGGFRRGDPSQPLSQYFVTEYPSLHYTIYIADYVLDRGLPTDMIAVRELVANSIAHLVILQYPRATQKLKATGDFKGMAEFLTDFALGRKQHLKGQWGKEQVAERVIYDQSVERLKERLGPDPGAAAAYLDSLEESKK